MQAHPDHDALNRLAGLTCSEVERDLILATLRLTGGNRTRAATLLSISLRTLRNKIGAYAADGYDVPEPSSGVPSA